MTDTLNMEERQYLKEWRLGLRSSTDRPLINIRRILKETNPGREYVAVMEDRRDSSSLLRFETLLSCRIAYISIRQVRRVCDTAQEAASRNIFIGMKPLRIKGESEVQCCAYGDGSLKVGCLYLPTDEVQYVSNVLPRPRVVW